MSGKCQNNGQCVNNPGSYTCTCTAAYTGWNCSININDCETDNLPKCKNGGTCVDGEGKFTCSCKEPYMGMRTRRIYYNVLYLRKLIKCFVAFSHFQNHKFLAQQIDVCICSAFCLEFILLSHLKFVSLIVKVGSHKSHLNILITGLFCDYINGCKANKNLCNNGTCDVHPRNGTAYCICGSGYNGTFCETDVDECALNPCAAPERENCVNTPGSYKCECKPGYSGWLEILLELKSIPYAQCFLPMHYRYNQL